MALLQLSFSGAVLILAVITIRAVAINRLPKKMFLILWEISIARLLLPVSIPSVFSVYSLIGRNEPLHATIEKSPAAVLLAPARPAASPVVIQPAAPMPEAKKLSFAASLISAAGLVTVVFLFATSAKAGNSDTGLNSEMTGRIAELGLTEQADMPDGYYINMDNTERVTWQLTDSVSYIFIDWGGDFTGDLYPGGGYCVTMDRTIFEKYLSGYPSFEEMRMPFFFRVEDGVVKGIFEYPFM